jgi:hypothetical protein
MALTSKRRAGGLAAVGARQSRALARREKQLPRSKPRPALEREQPWWARPRIPGQK